MKNLKNFIKVRKAGTETWLPRIGWALFIITLAVALGLSVYNFANGGAKTLNTNSSNAFSTTSSSTALSTGQPSTGQGLGTVSNGQGS